MKKRSQEEQQQDMFLQLAFRQLPEGMTAPTPHAWSCEEWFGDFLGGGYWDWNCTQEFPSILHQEDLVDSERYKNITPLFTHHQMLEFAELYHELKSAK
jgi:hypothetical protein